MSSRLTKLAAGCLALTAVGRIALSREPMAPPPSATPAPTSAATDDAQLPAIRGEFERLTLTARGDTDGFILKDGTEVKTAPALSAQIALSIKPGDRVSVRGLRAAALPLVHAVSITDETRQKPISDSSMALDPPPRPAPPPPFAPATSSETSGRVRMALHGLQGEVNGALLEGGTILRFPPDLAGRLSALLQPHQPVVADGVTITNAWGTVVDVQQMGPSKERLVAVGPPSPPNPPGDDRGAAGPRRGPPPPFGVAAPPPPPPSS